MAMWPLYEKAFQSILELQARLAPLAGEFREAYAVAQSDGMPVEFPVTKLNEMFELQQKINRTERFQLGPIMVKFCLVRIEGLEYQDDGEDVPLPATVELLIERGPDELYDEIVAAMSAEHGARWQYAGMTVN
jgi:hypothetical protein